MNLQVENLLENIDVKIEVTRDRFLELNSDYFTRVTGPIDQALLTSSITMDEISEVILMGGGTRVPKWVPKKTVSSVLSQFCFSECKSCSQSIWLLKVTKAMES